MGFPSLQAAQELHAEGDTPAVKGLKISADGSGDETIEHGPRTEAPAEEAYLPRTSGSPCELFPNWQECRTARRAWLTGGRNPVFATTSDARLPYRSRIPHQSALQDIAPRAV